MKQLNILFSLLISIALVFAIGCNKDGGDDPDPQTSDFFLGWSGDDNMAEVPATTNFGFGSDNLPASYNIVDKFPPMGNQGSYGTCVAWAAGYNAKTAINGIENNYGPSQLASASNQASPKDLFISIADSDKNADCKGTGFTQALQAMQDRGVASLAAVPYTDLGNCSQSNQDPSWAQDAANHKIKYWRKIDGSHSAIKKNLSQNVPVVFGARLADNFMAHNTDDVITSATSYDNVGMHAYHAMVIAGYDDNKGPNGAYRIINSWGTGWGSSGYAWIDYNFFFSEFLMGSGSDRTLFMAANESGDDTPPDDNDPPSNTGVDLIPWVFSDMSTSIYTTEREVEFNIYNVGNQTAPASADWSFYYIYFNAFDANNYGVIFYDEFNTSIEEWTHYCDGNHCIINVPLESGSDLAYTMFQTETLYQNYDMPEITGLYYLLGAADAGDVFQEQDEMNNLFYPSLLPIYFEYGIEYKSSEEKEVFKFENDVPFSKENIKRSKFNTVVNDDFKNAYTSEEILAFFKKEKRNGNIDKKIQAYKDKKATNMRAKK